MTNKYSESLPPGKLANTSPGVLDVLRSRWSPRSFSGAPISGEELQTLLEAGQWAASSYNEQPWRFIVATKEDTAAFQSLLSVLVPFNQLWAKNAAVLLLTVGRTNFSHDGSPNGHALHDVGAATAQISLQATALGLQAHAMAGFDHAKAREVAGVPAEFQIGAVVAIGHPDTPDKLANDQLKERELAPRQRKPLTELTFKGRWGQPLAK